VNATPGEPRGERSVASEEEALVRIEAVRTNLDYIASEEEALVRIEAVRTNLDYILEGHVAPGDVERLIDASARLLDRCRLWVPVRVHP
jgi:hypothetical protein